MHCLLPTTGQLLVSLTTVLLAQADYIIDDRNRSITYFPTWDTWSRWLADDAQVFSGTLTGVRCVEQNGCHISIPFVGTGIHIYNAIFAQFNLSFTVDGGSSTTYILDYDVSCYPSVESGSSCYNKSVYNNQSLTYGSHTLDIHLNSYLGTVYMPVGSPNLSDCCFDYAVISSPATSSSEAPSSTGSITTSSQRPPKPLTAAISGALGGITGVVAIVLAVFYHRKRNRRRGISEIDPEPENSPYQPSWFITDLPHSSQPAILHDWAPTSLIPDGVNTHMPRQADIISPFPMPKHPMPHDTSAAALITTPSVLATPKPQNTTVQSEVTAAAPIPTPLVSTTMKHQHPSPSHPPQPAEAEDTAPAHSAPTLTPTDPSSSRVNNQLTHQQTELVQDLLRRNLPVSAVAGVIEVMLREERQSGGGDSSSDVLEVDNPPDYDFIA